jgi:hypothetical protein
VLTNHEPCNTPLNGLKVDYSTYAIPLSDLSETSEHCLSIEVGNGWWKPKPLKMFGQYTWSDTLATGEPMFILRMELQYNNGAVMLFC